MRLARSSRRSHGAGRAIGLASAIALGGCGDERETMRGEFVTVISDVPGEEICPGTVRYLDESYRAIADYLAVDSSSRRTIRYHYTKDVHCPGSDVGCAYGNGVDVWATSLHLTHELVHALHFQKRGDDTTSIPFFEEGLAVALGQPTGSSLGWDLSRVDADVLATNASEIDPQAAGFVAAYLLNSRGFAPYESLLVTLANGSTREEIDAAFVTAYGTDLASLLADEIPSAPYFVDRNRLGLPECFAEPTPWISGHMILDATIDCSDERVRGDLAHENGRLSATFSVPSSGTYVEIRRGPARFRLDACAPQSYPPPSGFAPVSRATVVFRGLDEGAHFVTIDAERSASVRYDLAAAPPIPVADCLDDVPTDAIPVDASVEQLAIAGSPTGGMPEAHFLLQSPSRARYAWEGVTAFELCRGACGAQQCDALSERSGFEIDLTPGYYVLRAQRTSTSRAGGSLSFTPLPP